MIIATDFDGTLCTRNWPGIGEPNTKLIEFLIQSRKNGDKIILWTCRHDECLQNAVDWCRERGLEFDAVNDNVQERIDMYNDNSRKVSADMYIDDQAIGVCYPRGKSIFALFGETEFTISADISFEDRTKDLKKESVWRRFLKGLKTRK